MATKTATKKSATKSAPKKTTKVSTKKASTTSKSVKLPAGVVRERNPEAHVATGKYKFFFVFFSITTVLFAAVAVWLFVFSSEVLNKWEQLEKRVESGSTCVEKVNYSEDTTNTATDETVNE